MKHPHFMIVSNDTGPGWPGIRCSVRGDLGCLIAHAKAAGYRADGFAGRLGLSPRSLRREFRAAFGITVKKWLVMVRSVEVRERLRGEESIEEIAYSVGFSHAKELSREFMKVYQVSPSDYRRRETTKNGSLAEGAE